MIFGANKLSYSKQTSLVGGAESGPAFLLLGIDAPAMIEASEQDPDFTYRVATASDETDILAVLEDG